MRPYFLTDQIANIAFWVVYIAWILPELIGGFIQRSGSNAHKRDRGSSIVLYAAVFVGVSLAFMISTQTFSAIVDARAAISWIGIALIALGALFRWYAIRVLGKFFTRDVAISAEQTVIENGPYRYIRHPAYTGSLISFLGLGLALGNWLSIAAVMGCVTAGYAYRVRVEERALAEELGQPYRDYMQRTRRFIPFVV